MEFILAGAQGRLLDINPVLRSRQEGIGSWGSGRALPRGSLEEGGRRLDHKI